MLKQVALALALGIGLAAPALAQDPDRGGEKSKDRGPFGQEEAKPEKAAKLDLGVLKLTPQDVQKVKEALIKRGYAFRTADGKVDREMKDVLSEFQKDTGLKNSTKLDLPTLDALGFGALVAIASDVPGADLAKSGTTERPAGLPSGASVVGQSKEALGLIVLGKPQIEAIQDRLKDEGYYHGDADGAVSKELLDAVKRFQQANGIKQPMGALDVSTLVWFPEVHIKVKVSDKPGTKGEPGASDELDSGHRRAGR